MRKAILTVLGLILAAGSAFAANEVIVTEIMYNSTEATDVEWVELFNNTGATIDLTGWYVLDDNLTHTKAFLSGMLAPGEVKVLVGTQSLFTAKYPTVTNYFPVFFQQLTPTNWALGNSGDALQIFDAADQLVFGVTFLDVAPWPTSPDGAGPSLELLGTNCANLSSAVCWHAGVTNGTPGVIGGVVPTQRSTWGTLKSLYR